MWAIIIIFLVGAVTKVIVAASYYSLKNKSINIAHIRNGIVRQIRLRYENCIKLNIPISNIRAFVEKYLQKYSLGLFRVTSLLRMSDMCMLLIVIATYIYAYSTYKIDIESTISALFTGVMCFMALSVMDKLLMINNNREYSRILIEDYLENVLQNRIVSKENNKNRESLKEENTSQNEVIKEDRLITNKEKEASKSYANERTISQEPRSGISINIDKENAIINDILMEFFE